MREGEMMWFLACDTCRFEWTNTGPQDDCPECNGRFVYGEDQDGNVYDSPMLQAVRQSGVER